MRPLFWRLPLIALVIIGLGTLLHVDGLLRREYRREADTQAVQTDALLESFLRQRIALLHSLRAVYATGTARNDDRRRRRELVREVFADAPDLAGIYVLDPNGTVLEEYRQPATPGAPGAVHTRTAARARALEQARDSRTVALTSTLRLRDDETGMVAYLPIIRDSVVSGFIGASFGYQALFDDALAGQLQGRFAYRVTDDRGTVIAVSPDFPASVRRRVSREVLLPGDRRWQLEVALSSVQPLTARLVTWTAGVLFLVLFALLVLREEARARRFAAHTAELEELSSHLLDANVRVEERAAQIAEANRAKSRFLANVSHELRTPLNAIVGYNSLALDGLYGALPAGLRTAHDRIGAAAEHLLALVNDVLDLSKIEVGRMEVDLQDTDLESIIDSVITVVQPSADAKGLRLDVFVARDLPVVRTDPRHVRQILMNLVSNAIKFTDRGSVTIVARRSLEGPERFLSLVVQDTGTGIAAPDHERIFEEFEQVRPSGRGDSMQRGTGLGLAISRKLARLLGGDIHVESALGEGSRFTAEIPLEPPLGLSERTPTDRAVAPHVEHDDAAAARRAAAQAEESGERAAVGSRDGEGYGVDARNRDG